MPVQVGSGSEATPFPGLVERTERAMSILWRGADLGTQAHSGSGQGQGASLQGDETAALDEDRAAWLTESLASVSRTAIKYLFGEGVQPLAHVRLKTQVKRDIQLDLAVDAFLLSNGAPVGVADVLARYNRPTPAADEPLLKPPGRFGGSGGGGAKGAASEDAALASIERAGNRAVSAFAIPNDNPYHDARGRFTDAAGAVTPGNKHGAPKRDPRGVKRTDHHAVTVSTLKKVNFSDDVISELEKLKVPAGPWRNMPKHEFSDAHMAYNGRVYSITAQYDKLVRLNGRDPSTMVGMEAKRFAEGLMKQINADAYCKQYNEMVAAGATTKQLNEMCASATKLLETKPTLTKSSEVVAAEPDEAPLTPKGEGEPAAIATTEAPVPDELPEGTSSIPGTPGTTIGVLNAIGVLHDFLTTLEDASPDGERGQIADAIAMRDLPPDKHPGFLGRLYNILFRDPSPYYTPERLKELTELRQEYRDHLDPRSWLRKEL